MKKKKKVLSSAFAISLLLIACIIITVNYYYNKQGGELVLTSHEVDENGLYYAGNHAFKAMEPYEEAYIRQMSEKLNRTYKALLNEDMKVYYSVIPEKGYFIENPSFSKENYESMLHILLEEVEHMEYISIIDLLSIEDYYQTDHHWKQEKLFPVVKQLGKYMDFKVNKREFKEAEFYDYRGVYSGYMKENPKETLKYLTSELTDSVSVKVYDQEIHKGVYYVEQLQSEVPYNVFLNGPSPFITITNSEAKNQRELILFGDSFASSLTPLLLEAYKKITIIDLRFVPTSYLPELMEFTNQDVLFLYNAAVINRSSMLRFDSAE